MPVQDFYLSSIFSGSTTSVDIQPATGTVYSFKRGMFSNRTEDYASISIAYRPGSFFYFLFSGSKDSSNFSTPGGEPKFSFTVMTFSEAGSYFNASDNVGYAEISHPFGAISNYNYVRLSGINNTINTGSFLGIGVSLS